MVMNKSLETNHNSQSAMILPKLRMRSISPTCIPIKENIYSKVKMSDVFAMEKLILPKFKF